MKKIIFLLALTFTVVSGAFAQTNSTVCGPSGGPYTAGNCTAGNTDCTNPNNTFVQSGTVYTCNYTNSVNKTDRTNICAFIATGAHYSTHSVTNCYASTGAPVNAGLIFLIIAGAGTGFFFLRKQQKPGASLAV